MVQSGECLGFAFESREPLRIRGKHVWKDLQRDVALQARVAGAVDLAHAARTERRTDFIGAQPSPRFEGH